MDRAQVRRIRDLAEGALSELGESENLQFKLGRASYDPNGCATFQLQVSEIIDGEAYTVEKADFERYAPRYGLKASDFGKEFEVGGHWYEIVGAKPKNRTYPILGRKIGSEQIYKFRAQQVKISLDRQAARS